MFVPRRPLDRIMRTPGAGAETPRIWEASGVLRAISPGKRRPLKFGDIARQPDARCPIPGTSPLSSPRPRVRVSGCAPRWRRRILAILEVVLTRHPQRRPCPFHDLRRPSPRSSTWLIVSPADTDRRRSTAGASHSPVLAEPVPAPVARCLRLDALSHAGHLGLEVCKRLGRGDTQPAGRSAYLRCAARSSCHTHRDRRDWRFAQAGASRRTRPAGITR
jgi:hypothetical protein